MSHGLRHRYDEASEEAVREEESACRQAGPAGHAEDVFQGGLEQEADQADCL